jgi:predicted O-methyltransferase YrrM
VSEPISVTVMEIGVLNGENAKTMVEVAAREVSPEEVEYYRFDFFDGSKFQQVRQKLEKTGCKFQLFKGDTTCTLSEAVKTLPKMDLIFIDGGKSHVPNLLILARVIMNFAKVEWLFEARYLCIREADSKLRR